MLERLRPHWPRIKKWSFYGTIGFLLVFYGLLSHDDLPETIQDFELMSGREYAEMLRGDTDQTLVIDMRNVHTMKDVHANALLGDVDYEEMGRALADQSEELKGKNLVFI